MAPGYKIQEICQHSFVKSPFISLVEFQDNTIFFLFWFAWTLNISRCLKFQEVVWGQRKMFRISSYFDDSRMKGHNYMHIPTPDKPVVTQICLKFSTKLHCYQSIFPWDKKGLAELRWQLDYKKNIKIFLSSWQRPVIYPYGEQVSRCLFWKTSL